MLKVNDSRIPSKFVDVLTYGLQPSVNNRKMTLEQIRDILSLMPRVIFIYLYLILSAYIADICFNLDLSTHQVAGLALISTTPSG